LATKVDVPVLLLGQRLGCCCGGLPVELAFDGHGPQLVVVHLETIQMSSFGSILAMGRPSHGATHVHVASTAMLGSS
jgi:hypothetical protein